MEKEVSNNKETKKKGLELFVYDMKHPKLIIIKFLSFVIAVGQGVLTPFMTIYMKSLGITVQEMGIIFAVSSVTNTVSRFIIGIIADKLGNFKVLMSIMSLLRACSALLFLAIPVGRLIQQYPVNISLAIECGASIDNVFNDGLMLTDLDSETCEMLPVGINNVSLTLVECGILCHNSTANGINNFEIKRYRNAIFFPEEWTMDISCLENDCTFNRGSTENLTFYNVELTESSKNNSNEFMIQHLVLLEDSSKIKAKQIRCGDLYDIPVTDYVVDFLRHNSSEYYPDQQFCQPQCIVQTNRSSVCSNKVNQVLYNPQLTFWTYLLLINAFDFMRGGFFTLYGGATIAIVNQLNGDYGLNRIFSNIGSLASPLCGALMDYLRRGSAEKSSDYWPAFYIFASFYAVASIAILFTELSFKLPAQNLMKDIKSQLKNAELVVFIFISFMCGVFMSQMTGYLSLFLKEMGGTNTLIGWMLPTSALVSIPVLLFSDKIFRKIGHPNVFALILFFYGIRFIGYSYIYDPYMCLIFELLDSFTNTIMYTSSIIYAAELSTLDTLSSVQSLVTAAYFGLGHGCGSLLGGFLIQAFGTRVTFRAMGTTSFVLCFLYFFFNICYIRPKRQKSSGED